MHGHARSLVHDGKPLVFVNDVETNVFRKGLEWRNLDLSGYGDLLATLKSQRCLGRVPVNRDLVLLDQLLHPHPADVGQMGGQPLIETLARILWGDAQKLDVRGGVVHWEHHVSWHILYPTLHKEREGWGNTSPNGTHNY